MPKVNFLELLDELEQLIRQAGDAILDVYNSDDFNVEIKDDSFPLTRADTASHNILMAGLRKITPDVPVMSEEGDQDYNKEVGRQDIYWVIDPLDGTKDFIDRKDQFVINIGLVVRTEPRAGMVYAPALDQIYWGEIGAGAWRKINGNNEKVQVSSNKAAKRAVASRSHLDHQTEEFLEALGNPETRQYGSALKLTAVATGEADVYARFAPTMEWDTAAPDAIVRAAGGKMLGLDGTPLKYGKPGLRNNGFICYNGQLKLPEI